MKMQSGLKYFLFALIVLLVGLVLWYFKTIFVYILIATVLSLIGAPLMTFFRKVKIRRFTIPRGVSAMLTMFSLALLFLSFIALFIPLVIDEARIISSVNTNDVVSALQAPLQQLEALINNYQAQPISLQETLQTKLSTFLNFGHVSEIANTAVGIMGNIFVAFFAISFFTFFFLKDGLIIFETLLLLVPTRLENDVREIVDDSKRLLVKYFIGIFLDVLCVFVLVSSGLYLMGIQNALIIGFFAGIVNVVPYIGPLIAASFGLIVGFSANLDPNLYANLLPHSGKIVLVFVVVNLLDAMFLQPYIFSNTVKAHPLEIFIVIMVAGTLAGIGGMVIAVPLYTVLRVIAKQFLSHFKIVKKLTDDLEE